MVPTLHLTGDLVLVQRFSTKITRGDIVLVRSPENPRKIVAKRVTGMEGDEITFLVDPKKDDGKVKTVKVEQGHVWVTGDNVYDSRDSRTFGAVPSGLLYGRVFFRVWPFNAFGSLGSNKLKEGLFVSQERTTDPSVKSSAHLAIRPSVPPYAPPMIPVDNDDGIFMFFFFFSV
ncbi:hypothetical protein IFM89_034918 [Coptis chinensis]|uniref:Peptidase S26 domain-containing protein n=1 Tax=Coptis chinensis TaxID=261450 RepID=A0A835I339_9MAGN|nr:hypothetical protein IFM89_034918 [Coptis chinensis]